MPPENDAMSAAGTRYFFSIRFRQRLLLDREGIQLPPGADLLACARYLADKLGGEGSLGRAELAECTVEVTDRFGTLLVREAVSPA
jgi:hypothetical protein